MYSNFCIFELAKRRSVSEKAPFWRPCLRFLRFPCCLTPAFLPSKDQLSDWLQKRDSHRIVELSYLEVGLGSQTIHMQFGEGGAAYTLLVRDSVRCKRFFGLLTGKPRRARRAKGIFHFIQLVAERYQSSMFLSQTKGPPICARHDADPVHPHPPSQTEHVPPRAAFISRGLPHGPGTSGGIWKLNLTITSVVEKHAGSSGKVLQLVHVIPRFVLVRKRDENEVFHNYRFKLAEIGNTWERGVFFFSTNTRDPLQLSLQF